MPRRLGAVRDPRRGMIRGPGRHAGYENLPAGHRRPFQEGGFEPGTRDTLMWKLPVSNRAPEGVDQPGGGRLPAGDRRSVVEFPASPGGRVRGAP